MTVHCVCTNLDEYKRACKGTPGAPLLEAADIIFRPRPLRLKRVGQAKLPTYGDRSATPPSSTPPGADVVRIHCYTLWESSQMSSKPRSLVHAPSSQEDAYGLGELCKLAGWRANWVWRINGWRGGRMTNMSFEIHFQHSYQQGQVEGETGSRPDRSTSGQ